MVRNRRNRHDTYLFCRNTVLIFLALALVFGFIYLPLPESWKFVRHMLREGCQNFLFGAFLFIPITVLALPTRKVS